MSWRAWAYIWAILITGVVMAGVAALWPFRAPFGWEAFVVLTVLATGAQLFKVEAPNHQTYFATPIFVFAALLLVHPFFFVLVIVLSYGVEWVKERWVHSPLLRHWYLQPFNVATHVISGLVALGLMVKVAPTAIQEGSTPPLAVVLIAVITYTALNHLLIGLAIMLARGIKWRDSGILDPENLLSDSTLLALGFVISVLWRNDPWFIVLALLPLVLMYQALKVPQLKREAATDSKTGLWNARHFDRLFASELERARRFNRPLAFIMADLDLLRNINNTYGHLAGDAVLEGIAGVIKDTIRQYDVAARYGGEEFAIALPETNEAEALVLAERLRAAIEHMEFEVSTSPKPINATMSLGISVFPRDAMDCMSLIHVADVAVYRAKLRGRNCIVSASEASREEMGKMPLAPDHGPGTSQSTAVPMHFGGERTDDDIQAGARVSVSQATNRTRLFAVLVVAVIAAGASTAILGIRPLPPSILGVVGLLALLAAAAEFYHVDIHGDGTISVSLALNVAAALIGGMTGVVAVSASIALGHRLANAVARHFVLREAIYRTPYNWATHVLAGAAPVLLVGSTLTRPLTLGDWPVILFMGIAASIAYFVIDAGLVAAAIGLGNGVPLVKTWRDEFEWLAGHYLVLFLIGLFLALAHNGMGVLGVVVFTIPVLMMRYAQRQYLERTRSSAQELRRMNQELTEANRQIVSANRAVQELNDELFLSLGKIIDARDPYVLGHAAQVSTYASRIAAVMGLSSSEINRVRQAGFLHDIGKIAIAEDVLHKPTELTAAEYDHIKTHARVGAEFVETSQGLRHLAAAIRHHHEWWDGSGYPDRLRGEQIPLAARILAVCDAVEAMASDRPYHRAMSPAEIVAEIKRCAGTQFDPEVVDAFAEVVQREGGHIVVNSARGVSDRRASDSGDVNERVGYPDASPAAVWSR